MHINTTFSIVPTIILSFSMIFSNSAFADYNDDDDDERSYFSKFFNSSASSKYPYKRYLTPVNNPLYKAECGSCHFAFLPELLPEQSWRKILDNLDSHFSEDASIDEQTNKQLWAYLQPNSADKSGAKRAVKFMNSLAYNSAPLRITEIPYMVSEHRKINKNKIKRNTRIQTMSNCVACHVDATQGNFDDD